jgi:hypothetical protein
LAARIREKALLEAEESIHDALDLPAIPIQVKDTPTLWARQPLLVEKHFVVVFRIVQVRP